MSFAVHTGNGLKAEAPYRRKDKHRNYYRPLTRQDVKQIKQQEGYPAPAGNKQ